MAYDVSRGTVYADGAMVPRELRQRFAETASVADFGARPNGLDATAAFNRAIAWAMARGGATLLVPVGTYRIDGQLAIPYTGTPPVQKPIIFRGAGAHFTGGTVALGPTGPNGASVLDLRYSGSYGKILTLGHGMLGFRDLSFTDTAGTTTAFIYTTNTSLNVKGCSFFGSKSGAACDQDALVLGGTVAAYGDADPTHGFQGYGTVIEQNYFDGIRRAVFGQVYANAIVVKSNTIWAKCGGVAPFEFVGNAVDNDTGNVIIHNLIELSNYQYGVKLTNAFGNVVAFNGLFDNTGTTLAGVLLSGVHGGNIIIPGMKMASLPHVSGLTAGANDIVYGPWDRLEVGGAIPGADGEALRIYAGVTSDHAYMTFRPRSADPTIRGGFVGFAGGAATTEFYVKGELGPLYLDALSNIAALRPLTLGEAIATPAAGNVTLDCNKQMHRLDLGTAAGSWTVIPSNGYEAALVTVTIRNTSAGAVTVTWNAAIHLAGAWINPASGFNRSVTLRKVGAAWYEVSRSAADVAN